MTVTLLFRCHGSSYLLLENLPLSKGDRILAAGLRRSVWFWLSWRFIEIAA
jgi:hypothetical protein